MKRFENRAVFVTGGAHGIGRACARRLVQEGVTVAVVDIDFDAARQVAAEIVTQGGTAEAIACDVTDTGSVNAAIAASVERFGHLDALVHTAGGNITAPLAGDEPDVLWDRIVDFNLTGAYRCVQAALPHLLRSRHGGNAVMISSVNGIAAFGGYPYSAAKAGLTSLAQNFAAEYGHQGLRFNVIAPGTIRTRAWDNQPDALERLSRMYPLGRIGEPDDIAAAVAFLASSDAAWITGIVLPVEGGVLTGPRALMVE